MIQLGHTKDSLLQLSPKELTKHLVIFGSTGSGKTGQLIAIVEELVKKRIPVVLVDIKGDLLNLANQTKGLEKHMLVRVLTPGAMHGDPVNIFSGLSKKEQVSSIVTSFLEILGINSDPLKSAEHVYLTTLLTYLHRKGEHITLEGLIENIVDPPFSDLGVLPLDAAISENNRNKLAAQINNILASPVFEYWKRGVDLDFTELFSKNCQDRTPIIVYSVAHLDNQKERQFAISHLLSSYRMWLFQQPGSDELRSVFLLDECVGLLPPHPFYPSTKGDIMLLLKQGRAFGGGVILATQNPKDIDYKALANCNTWILGKLLTKNDRDRVLEGINTTTGISKRSINDLLAGLRSRMFICVRDSSFTAYKSKTTEAKLSGPLTVEDIVQLKRKGLIGTIYDISVAIRTVLDLKKAYEDLGTYASMTAYLKAVSDYKRMSC